ncbi:hypothetical protein ACSNN7_08290 [Micromonospora sp. URMC 105]|uniref:ApeA N-terminal domain 1-containing protein n=1 Tax=Micromonospora sp. URMC 105 TaxID=3423413 RepID=UPI003F1B1E53
MTDGVPLRLRVDPDEYRCKWRIPRADGSLVEVDGDVELKANRPPRAGAYGDVPVAWDLADGQHSAGFPQVTEIPYLRGRMLNGQDVVLIDSTLWVWAPDRALIDARAALVGPCIEDQLDILFDVAKVQISGLDAIAGIGPLRPSMPSPRPEGEPYLAQSWRIDGEPRSAQEWADENAEVRLEFDGSFSLLDPYFHRMSFSPVVVIKLQQPISFDQFIERWLEPLRRLTSLATGRQERTTFLSMASPGPEALRERLVQVYGFGLHQAPFASRRNDLIKVKKVFTTAGDRLSLLHLLNRWQSLGDVHHPLLETYGSSIVGADQHPRARFLLLIQALEGMYGYETREDFVEREKRHVAQRGAVLAAVQHSLYKDAQKFLKNYLSKRPPESLDTALSRLFKALPIDVMPRLAETSLVKLLADDARRPQGVPGALRLIRNDLSHGTRGYDTQKVNEVAGILEQVARAHLLRILGCASDIQERALEQDRN